MDVVVTVEHRFDRTPDGTVWTQTAYGRSFWSVYLDVFDSVRIVARVRRVSHVPERAKRADGERVSFVDVPYYIGPLGYALRAAQVKQAARAALNPTDAVILRVPSRIGACVEPFLNAADRPHALEVLGDPNGALGPGTSKHPLRPVFRQYFKRQLRRQCARAHAVSYVTKDSLQVCYPATVAKVVSHYSDVELPREAFADTPRKALRTDEKRVLITVGSLEQLFKGVDVLLEAVNSCVESGMDLHLTVVGDGRYRSWVEDQAQCLGDRIEFLGSLPAGSAVREQLDKADLFVMASRYEGLPKALLEAMARALPCIATAVGGIPELLASEDLVPANDSRALAVKIAEIVRCPERMASMSMRNLHKARQYALSAVKEHRLSFYKNLRVLTEEWVRSASMRPNS